MSSARYVTLALASDRADGWINGTTAMLGSPLETAWATYAHGLLLDDLHGRGTCRACIGARDMLA
jgi:hypothetical protein